MPKVTEVDVVDDDQAFSDQIDDDILTGRSRAPLSSLENLNEDYTSRNKRPSDFYSLSDIA
eukprot:CAMPEP_0170452726 /NCGR_PEP_ID=MMETSP0123-20130129/1520_1 /TAXON_ID=182087 /ORGANISM="Favella ehrenbergii, Strain Fehren 1" /LENGTH=60 /DNA_ID=CAMNT_0010714811 /DNA_START=1721 /DNA_END=1903 /DNA_ORIENTATION=+